METIDKQLLHIRQSQLIAPELADAVVLVAGAGMLGSWTALTLARCAHELHVWDFDTVENVNAGTQAYTGEHFDQPKVEALAAIAQGLPVIPHIGRFPIGEAPADLVGDLRYHDIEGNEYPEPRKLILVSAVDSFTARRDLAAWARFHNVDLFVDTRAHGEIAVHCVVPPEKLEDYLADLPTDEEAPEPMCGAEGTAYTGQMIAARVAAGINSYFKGLPVPLIQVEDMGTGEVLNREVVNA